MENKLHVTWDEYFKLCDNLIDQVKDMNFTSIVAISRGGMMPSQYIAYKLGIRKIYNFGIMSYEDNTEASGKGKIEIYQKIPRVTETFRILIIDDIADSGHTLDVCMDTCEIDVDQYQYNYGVDTVKTATLHYKPRSIIKPDFFSKEVPNDTWVVYPYDR